MGLGLVFREGNGRIWLIEEFSFYLLLYLGDWIYLEIISFGVMFL